MANRFQIISTSAYILTATLFVGLCIRACDGHLVYTLDDPYIHLAVAENILRGGYGVNLGEFSSPSSSIIWPYLMAGALWMGFGDFGPLLINFAASAASVWIFSGLTWDCIFADAKIPVKSMWLLVVIPLLILSINTLALPMTGMEHSLHVLSVFIVISGLANLAKNGKASPLLALGIIISPLIRFEGMALSLAALLMLVYLRKYWVALFVSLILGTFLSGWIVHMKDMGLPPLPSSVMAKSYVSAAAVDGNFISVLQGVAHKLYSSLTSGQGVYLAMSIALLLIVVGTITESTRKRECALVVVAPAVFALVAHMLFGHYGWFGRYEVYAIAIVLASVVWTYPLVISTGYGSIFRVVGIGIVLAVAAVPYLVTTVKSPAASRNIYEQQYQMHRFATEFFPNKVAVNDLGLVAYRNDKYVLDLAGLGSEYVRRLGRAGQLTSVAIDKMAEDRGVAFAMLYDSWYAGQIPSQWCRISVLHTSKVTAADDKVTFYLLHRDRRQEMTTALTSWGRTLPRGSTLEILGCNAQ